MKDVSTWISIVEPLLVNRLVLFGARTEWDRVELHRSQNNTLRLTHGFEVSLQLVLFAMPCFLLVNRNKSESVIRRRRLPLAVSYYYWQWNANQSWRKNCCFNEPWIFRPKKKKRTVNFFFPKNEVNLGVSQNKRGNKILTTCCSLHTPLLCLLINSDCHAKLPT